MYAIKYRISYHRKSSGITTIDIHDKALDVDDITMLTAAGDSPLEIAFDGDINNIYKPVLGSGATIRVMATPLSLRGLFTTDPQKYMVKVYNGNSEDSSGADNLVWQGFVNTGIYTESYSTPISLKSLISIYCNDGINVLEGLPYSQTLGGLNYTGFSTIGGVMSNIFSKLGIEFFNIRTATDLKYETHTNLFTALSVNNENYYDEQGVPMSCREVLESIFGGIGLVLSLKGVIIYIIDPIHLHLSDSAAKSYNTHPTYGSGESAIGFGGYLDISAGDIDWYETGQISDIVQPFTAIDITYDPYNFTETSYSFDGEGNASGGSWLLGMNHEIDFTDWVFYGGVYGEGIKPVTTHEGIPWDYGDPIYYIRQTPDGTGNYSYTFPNSNINQDETVKLELSMEVYVNTKNDPPTNNKYNIFDAEGVGTEFSSLFIGNIEIKVGDKFFNSQTVKWQDAQCFCHIYVRQLDADIISTFGKAHYGLFNLWYHWKYVVEDQSVISDKWVPAILYIPIDAASTADVTSFGGLISIEIEKASDVLGVPVEDIPGIIMEDGTFIAPSSYDASVNIVSINIKNISIKVVTLNKIPISNDRVLSNATIPSALNMKKSDLPIKLKNGIGPYGVSRGAFSSNEATIAGLNITGLSRADDVVYKPTDLLLQSLLGQYGSPRFILNGKLNLADYINVYTFFSEIFFHLIKDSDYSDAIAYHIVSGTYHDREEYMDVEMVELTTIRGVIV